MECDCGKEACLQEVRDFRGNGIAVVCADCAKELRKLLDRVFRHYGESPACVPAGIPLTSIPFEQLKAEVAGYK